MQVLRGNVAASSGVKWVTRLRPGLGALSRWIRVDEVVNNREVRMSSLVGCNRETIAEPLAGEPMSSWGGLCRTPFRGARVLLSSIMGVGASRWDSSRLELPTDADS